MLLYQTDGLHVPGPQEVKCFFFCGEYASTTIDSGITPSYTGTSQMADRTALIGI